jgi:glycosyltransferase involved in cell wall biosynthesis
VRVIYTDPGLRDNQGHHANSCRAIRGELLRRGVGVVVVAMNAIAADLRAELNAIPVFRAYTYWQTDGDPLAGWLNVFERSSRATAQDLARLVEVGVDDLFYLNSAQPAQFHAMVQWAQSMPIDRRPHMVIEFGTEPGVDVVSTGNDGQMTIRTRDYRADPRPMFYRFAAGQLSDDDLPKFHLATFDPMASRLFSVVLGKPVGVLPTPQFTRGTVVSRTGRRPITVAVLGHQRPDKGYHLMPAIARLLLAEEPEIRLLSHSGGPDIMPTVQKELRDIAAHEPRLMLDERTADAAAWDALLRASDLILCPYDPARYRGSYSAVATEAVANGIPMVVPTATSMSDLLGRFGDPGTCFDAWTPEAVVAATRRALAEFDTIAARAAAAGAIWGATMGVGHMVDALLAYSQPGRV